MQGVYLQSLRLLAALPLEEENISGAFDLDDVVQRRTAVDAHGTQRGCPSTGGNRGGGEGRIEGDNPSRAGRMKGLVIRTPRGIQDCSQDLDPEHMDPDSDEVQVAWEDGTVENVNCRKLELVDRCLYVGDTVLDEGSGSLGLVVEVQQSLDIAIPVEAFKAGLFEANTSEANTSEASLSSQPQHHGAAQSLSSLEVSPLPSRLSGIRARVMGAPTLSLEPPVLQQLQQFNEGMPVVSGGRMGCVVGGKVDYVVALDSGHEFTLEEGMVGVRPEPRRGHPMSWVSGLYPSLPVYVTGEWIRHFQSQVERASAAAGSNQSVADAGRLCRGYVKSFAIRNIKVAWQLQGPLTASGSYQGLAPWTEHEPTDLLPLQQTIMRLGQPVYVDVHRVQQTERPNEKKREAAAARTAEFGSAHYTVGVVDRLHTTCTVLWETGSLETDVDSHRLTPVALDRTPLDPTECQLAPLLLPHMVVQRRKQRQEKEGALNGSLQQTPKLPWWLHLHFGGLQVGCQSSIDPHLANAAKNSDGARVYKEVALALGVDEGTVPRRSDHSALLQAAAERRQRQQQGGSSSRNEEEPGQHSNGTVTDGNSRDGEDAVGPPDGAFDREPAYDAARLLLPLLLRFLLETDVAHQMLEVPSKRMPLLRRGTSAAGNRRPRSPGGALVGDASQAPSSDSPGISAGGSPDVQGDDAARVSQEAQALAGEIFSFEGGPSLEAVASFLHLVYSHGQWGGSGGEEVTARNLRQIFEAVALVLGDAGAEATMDSAPQLEAAAGVELGIVVSVQRKEKKALIAWIRDIQQFSITLREQHTEYFATAARDPYCIPPPIEQVMHSLGITAFTTGKLHSSDGPDVLSIYKEAEGRIREDKWKSMVDLRWEPYGVISVQPQHLFFPGDLAVLRPDRLPGMVSAPSAGTLADTRVFIEIIGFCGGSLWGRTLDGVVAPFLASDLLPLIFRRLEDLLDDSTSSEEGSEYSRDASDVDAGEWEDDDSGSDSTNITSLSGESDLSDSSRAAPS